MNTINILAMTPYEIAEILLLLEIITLSILLLYIIITTISFKLFKKAGRTTKEAIIPIYNLVVLLQIAEIPAYFFFTLLVPVLNIVVIVFIEYKLGKLFKVSKPFMTGLFLLPIVFIPILANNKYIYKEPEEEVFISISDEMPTVLSQEQIDELNKEEAKEPKIDNVFKADIKVRETAPTYKASKVIVNEEFKNKVVGEPDPIERVEAVKAIDIAEIQKKNKFIEEEKIEIVEL